MGDPEVTMFGPAFSVDRAWSQRMSRPGREMGRPAGRGRAGSRVGGGGRGRGQMGAAGQGPWAPRTRQVGAEQGRDLERRAAAPTARRSGDGLPSIGGVSSAPVLCSRSLARVSHAPSPSPSLCPQYDAAPVQSSVVLCSCPSPSMVRTQTESSAAPGVPSGGSRQGPTMDSTAAEARPNTRSLQHAAQPPPQPRKKRPEDFKFGKILGEGSFSTVSTCCCCWLNEGVFLGNTGLSPDAELGDSVRWWSSPDEGLRRLRVPLPL